MPLIIVSLGTATLLLLIIQCKLNIFVSLISVSFGMALA